MQRLRSSNPFIAGPSVGHTAAFVGREDVIRRVEMELNHGVAKAMVLYGQRRIGKTSVLEALATRLPEFGPYRTVIFDLQDKAHEPLDEVLSLLAHSIAACLDLPPPDFQGDARRIFREEWLPGALRSSPTSRLVLLFDEFDVIADPKMEQAAKALFPYLRDLLRSDLSIFVVFTLGRSIGELSADALSLFKGIQSYKISVLDHRDANRILSLSEENGSLRWSPEARSLALDRTHGHPYFLQQIGKELWISLVAGKPSTAERKAPLVEPGHVDAVLGDVLAHSQNVLEWLWEGLTPACRLVASAFAEHGSYVKSDDELQQLLQRSGVKSVIRELIDAPRLLREWDLIESVGEGYRFRVELLRTWIRLNKPLRMVQDELDRLQPAAENAYNLAVHYEKSGQLKRAVELLREALEQNPNHVGAAVALSEIYVSQGSLDDAIRQLELLHENLPSIATPKLANVLVMRARQEVDPLSAESLYEKALAISPHNGEAKRGLQQLWIERGRQFERVDRLEDALQAYGRANSSEDQRRVERELEFRGRASRMERLRHLEAIQNFSEALTLAHALSGEIPQSPPNWGEPGRNWMQYIEDLSLSRDLALSLRQGVEHLRAGKREEATPHLLEVVRRKVTYPEAARYLYWAIEGSDPKDEPVRSRGGWRERAFPYVATFAVIACGATISTIVMMQGVPSDKPPVVVKEIVAGACPPDAASEPEDAKWTPTPEMEMNVKEALVAPFAETASDALDGLVRLGPDAEDWANEQIGRIYARRIAWYDLTIGLAPKSRQGKLREKRALLSADRAISYSQFRDDIVVQALSDLLVAWGQKRTPAWLDNDKNELRADYCISAVGSALKAILAGNKSGRESSLVSAEKSCRNNPVLDVLKQISVSTKPSTPLPSPTDPFGPSNSDPVQLLEEARKAMLTENEGQAYTLAAASYSIDKSVDALTLMGVSACKIPDRNKAEAVYRKLPDQSRPQISAICAASGILLR